MYWGSTDGSNPSKPVVMMAAFAFTVRSIDLPSLEKSMASVGQAGGHLPHRVQVSRSME